MRGRKNVKGVVESESERREEEWNGEKMNKVGI